MHSLGEGEPLSAGRRAGLALAAAAVSALLLEAFSFVALGASQRRVFSPEHFAQQRQEIASGEGRAARPASTDAAAAKRPAASARTRFSYETEIVHPYLGFVRDPDKNRGISKFGFPSPHPPLYRRSADQLIVGIFGGSVAEQLHRGGRGVVEQVLRSHPAWSEREFVFVPLGIGGYKQPQQLLALNYVLSLGGEFDVIINLDGFNEVALHPTGNGRKGIAAVFPRYWYYRIQSLPDPELRKIIGEIVHYTEARKRWGERFQTGLLRYSPTANLVWRLRDASLARAIAAHNGRLEGYQPQEKPVLETGPAVPYETERSMYEDLVAIWRRCSVQMHRLARANGIQYFHFLQPNQYVEGSKPLTAEELRTAYRETSNRKVPVERGYPLLMEAGRALTREGVPYFDLTMMFADSRETLYRDACCHLNARGNELLAREIGRRILERVGADTAGTRVSGQRTRNTSASSPS